MACYAKYMPDRLVEQPPIGKEEGNNDVAGAAGKPDGEGEIARDAAGFTVGQGISNNQLNYSATQPRR
jgi:hypothetical protein